MCAYVCVSLPPSRSLKTIVNQRVLAWLHRKEKCEWSHRWPPNLSPFINHLPPSPQVSGAQRPYATHRRVNQQIWSLADLLQDVFISHHFVQRKCKLIAARCQIWYFHYGLLWYHSFRGWQRTEKNNKNKTLYQNPTGNQGSFAYLHFL